MKITIYILVAIICILIIWTIGSYLFESNIATPSYTVEEKKDGYEIRTYEPYITAEVDVTGDYDTALREGFRILADYIFGNNTTQKKLAMTAPVQEQQSEKLAMTAPVFEQTGENTRTISFVMPFEYTIETLPKPNNPNIRIVSHGEQKVAALRFSWFRTANRIAQKKEALLARIQEGGLTQKSPPQYAGYNAPFSAPWLNRHEILVEIE